MTVVSPEQWLTARLQAAGVEPAVPIEYGAKPLIEHADHVGQPARAWLEPLETFVRTLHSIPLDLWSPIHFCVPHLADVAGDRPGRFGELLQQTGELLTELHRRGVPLTRTEQYGVRAAAGTLGHNDQALGRVLAMGQRLAARGHDPGWLLQISVPELWNAAAGEEALFGDWLRLVEAAAAMLTDMGISVGYPFATGVGSLARHGAFLAAHLDSWMERIVQVSRSLQESALQPYGWYEYGLPGLSPIQGFPAGSVTRALDIARGLADRGIHSGELLQVSFGLAGDETPQTVAAFLGAAERLSRCGIDPFFVLTGGLAANAALLGGRADDAEGLERVLGLAEQLHAHGCSLRKTFEDGLPVLRELDGRWQGLFRRGFELAERIARAGIDPGMFLAWGLPRALAGADTRPWLEAECLAWAGDLAAAGADPEPALSYAVPAMRDMAGTDAEVFRTLRAALQDFIAMLAGLRLDYRDILFYDISALAENQEERSEAFIALLRRLEELVRRLVQFHHDPKPVLVSGLPAAARAGVRHRWILEESLDASLRLAGAGVDPRPILEQAAGPLAEAAGEDRAAFRRMCAVVEKRVLDIPDAAWPKAVQAASGVSGGRSEWLDEALTTVMRLLPDEHDPRDARAEFILALPQLGAMAADPGGFASLLQAFRSEVSGFGEHAAAKSAWLAFGIEACVVVAGRDHAAGIALLGDLARLGRTWDTLAADILRHGARAAAGIAGHDSPVFLEAMTSCAAAAERLEEMGREPQEALPRLVGVAAAAERGRRGQWADALDLQCEVLSKAEPEDTRLLDDLAYAEQLLVRWGDAWGPLVAPLLRSHGRYAGSLMYVLTQAPPHLVRGASDLDVLRDLVTQTGARALDIVCNLIIPAVTRGIIPRLADHRESLPRFVKDVGCWDADLYGSYWRIVSDKALSPSERRGRIRALRDGFTGLTAAIRSGNVSEEQERHPHFTSAMAYVFPPSVTVTLQSYAQLYAAMPDRPQDVSERDPGPDLRQRPYALGRGGWQLRPGAVANAAVWDPLVTALREAGADGASREFPATLGWDLLRHWCDGRLGRAEVKAVLWPRLLRLVRAAGVQLPREAGTAAQLQEIKRVFSDLLRDGVEEALLASRQEDDGRYDRMVRERMTPQARVGPGLAKSLWRQVEACRSGLIEAEEAARRLRPQLNTFAVEEATLSEILRADSIDGVRDILQRLGPRPVDPEPGREVQRVHAEVTGQEVTAMHLELFGGPQHPALLEYRAASMELELTCEVTKRRAHAAAGFTEGVCVVTDVTLWNNPGFLQAVFWDSDGICRGGMHLLVVESGGTRSLALPGINPSSHLLEIVEASTVLDMACDYAGRLAQAWGLRGVWIPAAPEIHSNRQAVREAIARRRWGSRSIPRATFSYAPFAYSFDEVLEVPTV